MPSDRWASVRVIGGRVGLEQSPLLRALLRHPRTRAVLVQLNLRLGADDLSYVIGHSRVSWICVDETLLPLAEALAPLVPGVKGWIVMTDNTAASLKTTLEPVHHHEDLLAASSSTIDWPMINEHSAYAACYTSGTTGRPKGVYYSHRSSYLHSTAMATNLGMTLDDCSMLVAPMFHAQGWGLPQAAGRERSAYMDVPFHIAKSWCTPDRIAFSGPL
jgi:fatty-acyl-CoA synthase